MRNLRIEIKWAILFSFTLLLWMLLENTLGWHDENLANHQWLTLLFTPVAIFLYVQALKEKRRRDYNGKMTWLQGFISGLLIGVFVAILSPLVQYLTHTYISPQYFPNMIEYSVANNIKSQEDAEAYFNLNSYMIQSAMGAVFMGAITAAIVAVFMRRK